MKKKLLNAIARSMRDEAGFALDLIERADSLLENDKKAEGVEAVMTAKMHIERVSIWADALFEDSGRS